VHILPTTLLCSYFWHQPSRSFTWSFMTDRCYTYIRVWQISIYTCYYWYFLSFHVQLLLILIKQ
jgi:hypothetical protein